VINVEKAAHRTDQNKKRALETTTQCRHDITESKRRATLLMIVAETARSNTLEIT